MKAHNAVTEEEPNAPSRGIGVPAAVSIAIGMVVGAGLFKSPAIVAENAGSDLALFGAWLLGGAISLIGALCYAELATAFPSRGGDYRFLSLAYGRWIGLLFAWARFAVINTGSIALLGFVLGDYVNAALPLGPYGPSLYAAVSICVLTLVNLADRRASVDTQMGLTSILIIGVLGVTLVGVYVAVQDMVPMAAASTAPASTPAFGVAMVFVLLAFGGWTEVATLSSEMKDPNRGMLKALTLSMVLVTVLYLLVNWALWRGLGLAGLAGADAPAVALLEYALGSVAGWPIILIVLAAVITSINATIIVGARTTFAAAKDWPGLKRLATWDPDHSVPKRAVLAQSVMALLLVGFGAVTREGFVTLVDYTAPVFWLFILLSAGAVIVLRVREPDAPRAYRVPAYPALPILFGASAVFVLWSSVAYVKIGSLVGLGILTLGGLVGVFAVRRN